MHTNSNESAENYLETILILSREHPVVRAVDIANELDFKKSSVSVAMKKLREGGHIEVSPEGYITLTRSGREIADRIYERHQLISTWLIRLGVDPGHGCGRRLPHGACDQLRELRGHQAAHQIGCMERTKKDISACGTHRSQQIYPFYFPLFILLLLYPAGLSPGRCPPPSGTG